MMGFWILLSTNILNSFIVNNIVNHGNFLNHSRMTQCFAKICYKMLFWFKEKNPVRSRKIPCFAKISNPRIWKKNLSPDPCVPLPPTILNIHQLKENNWLREWFYHYFFWQKTMKDCWVISSWPRKTLFLSLLNPFPADIYLFKVNNRNTKKGVKYVQRYKQKHLFLVFLFFFFLNNRRGERTCFFHANVTDT